MDGAFQIVHLKLSSALQELYLSTPYALRLKDSHICVQTHMCARAHESVPLF